MIISKNDRTINISYSYKFAVCWFDVAVVRSWGLLIEPPHSLIILPYSLFLCAINIYNFALPMPFTIHPISIIFPPICPCVTSYAMLLVKSILTFISPSIFPLINSHAMHLVVVPVALIFSAIRPCVQTFASYFVIDPVSVIVTIVLPCVFPLATLFAHVIVPLVFAAIHPVLDPITMLLIIIPLALILGTVIMIIYSVPRCFIIKPLSIIYISIYMKESSFSVGFVIMPLPLIPGSVWPYLDPVPFPQLPFPFPFVYNTIAESNRGPSLNCLGCGTVSDCMRPLSIDLTNHRVIICVWLKIRSIVFGHTRPTMDIIDDRNTMSLAFCLPAQAFIQYLAFPQTTFWSRPSNKFGIRYPCSNL